MSSSPFLMLLTLNPIECEWVSIGLYRLSLTQATRCPRFIRYISSSGLFPDNPIVSAPFRAEPFHGQFSGSSESLYWDRSHLTINRQCSGPRSCHVRRQGRIVTFAFLLYYVQSYPWAITGAITDLIPLFCSFYCQSLLSTCQLCHLKRWSAGTRTPGLWVCTSMCFRYTTGLIRDIQLHYQFWTGVSSVHCLADWQLTQTADKWQRFWWHCIRECLLCYYSILPYYSIFPYLCTFLHLLFCSTWWV